MTTATPTSGLRLLRYEKGLSARQLAAAAGVSYKTLLRAERGGVVSEDTADALAKVLGSAVLPLVQTSEPIPEDASPVLRARLESGLTQTEVAQRLGVWRSVLRRAERGQGVHPANARAIARFFDLPLADVVPAKASDPTTDQPA